MFRILSDIELANFYPEGFRIFYDEKNNRFKGVMPGLLGKKKLIKANPELMQIWCEKVLRKKGNYTAKKHRKLFFEAILEDAKIRIKEWMTNNYEKINCKITEKDVENFINNTLTMLS